MNWNNQHSLRKNVYLFGPTFDFEVTSLIFRQIFAEVIFEAARIKTHTLKKSSEFTTILLAILNWYRNMSRKCEWIPEDIRTIPRKGNSERLKRKSTFLRLCS